MSFGNKLLLSTMIGLTGLATAQADMKISRMDGNSLKRSEATQQTTATSSIYIVQMKDRPVIAYEGDIKGYKSTKPGKGKKLNPKSSNVKKYSTFLEKKQNAVVRSVNAERVYNYRYAINGFAARMTAADAEKLKKNPEVLNVWKDEIRQLQTDTSPNYIGLTEGGQAWSKGLTGEDIVIGIIDTGVWPEHPSFADVKTPKKGNKGPNNAYGTLDGFTVSGCDFGNTAANPDDAAFSCNNKLLAARCYNSGFSSLPDAGNPCGGDGAFTAWYEFQSGRDYNGHGSHTASTSGGNNGVPAYINDELQGMVSGVAPRARLASYKVCWDDFTATGDGGCASSDSAAAIDQAVIDGVDVINFSIGGSSNFFAAPDDIAFLFAADAGVFVATSNGNAGPGAGTVGTPSGVPWITAVGATQDDGVYNLDVMVNSPGSVAGSYIGVEGAGNVSLASAGPITADVENASDIYACGPIDSMPGKIALVSRGGCSFSAKYNNAADAGAVAIIVFNNTVGILTMSAPGTSIPGVMIGRTAGLALAGESGVNVTLDSTNQVSASNRIANFSSRGPNNGAPDIIKPDVSAPGVRILAAVSPAGANGEEFANYNGTSMASPHVAGSFALLKQAHPDWTPAIARSALMTTARNGLKKTTGDEAADPFDIGAGEILPSDAVDPGLAYNAGWWDYMAFSCDNNFNLAEYFYGAGFCEVIVNAGYSSDGSDLNLPSIGIADLTGSQTITRTVTAVYNNNGKQNFEVSVDAPPGVDVTVSPSSFKLSNGESQTYEVTFAVTDTATLNEWAFGSLTWTGGPYSVRSPIAVLPTSLSTVDEVDGVANVDGDGSVDVPVAFGYTGEYSASVSGILDSFSTPLVNLSGPQGNSDAWCVDLPPAMTHVRFATFDEDTSDPGYDDIDLVVYSLDADCANATALVAELGSSGGSTSEEAVDIPNANAPGYYVFVDFYSASNGTDTDYKLWIQPVLGDEGNTTVTAPASAVLNESGTVTVDYTGLFPTRNLGILHHMDSNGEITRTILDIDAR